MRLVDALGTTILPGTVPTGNLVWVDAISGNDSIASRGRLTVAFKTLTGAKTAAVAGDTIVVMPGTYNEGNLLKNGVNWFFFPGAVVSYAGTIFTAGSSNLTSFIAGHGEFINTSASATVMTVSASSCSIVLQAKRIQSSLHCIEVTGASSNVTVEVLQDIEAAIVAVYTSGASSNTIVRAHTIESAGGYTLQIDGGNLDVLAHRIYSSGVQAVAVKAGTGDIVIRAYEIYSATAAAVIYEATTYFPTLTIVGARIKSAASSSGFAIKITSNFGTNRVLRLSNCLLLPVGSNFSIDASTAGTYVQLSGFCVGKNGVNGVSLQPTTGAWATDSNAA